MREAVAPGQIPTGRTRLLLVGAGHTHLYVVKHAAALVDAGYWVGLLSPRTFHYSGVASAAAAGELPAEIGQIDVAALARSSGVEHHEGVLADVDLEQRVAVADDGTELLYDVISFNIGSVVAPPRGTVEDGVLRVKPLRVLADLPDRLEDPALRGAARVTIVGGGPSGLELAGHLSIRRDVAHVRLMEAGPGLGPDLPARAGRRLERLLVSRGVEVRTGCAIAYLGEQFVRCADGTELSHDIVILATGLAAPPLVTELGLGDRHGIPVRATLQHADHDNLYAVGDCACFLPRPLPRVGVHGVRQGPVLHASLMARIAGDTLPTYEPQARVLAILDLGAGIGLAARGRRWWQGRAALWLKRWIDRRWLHRYQTSMDGTSTRSNNGLTRR